MTMRLAWLLLLPLGLAIGCDGDMNDPDTDPPVGDDDDDDIPGDDDDDGTLDPARVRVLHLSDDLGPADLFVERIDAADDSLDLNERSADEVVVVEGLEVDEVSDYLAVAAGTREIELYASGADTPSFEADVALAADTDHTVVVWGDLPDLEFLVVEDDASTLPPGAIGLEVMNLTDNDGLTVFDATPAAEPVILLAQIPPEGETIAAGSSARLEIEEDVGALGIDLDGDDVIDLEIDLPAGMQAGEIHHLALQDDGAGGLDVLLVTPDGETQELLAEPPPPGALVRVANASVDFGTDDMLLERVDGPDVPLVERPEGEVLRFEDMPYAEISPYFGVSAGTRDLEFYLDGALAPYLDTTIDLVADASYTLFTWGATGALDAVAVEDDAAGLAAGEAALIFTHLAASLSEIDVLDVTDPVTPVVLVDDLALEESARVDLPVPLPDLALDVDDDLVADYTLVLVLAPIAADEQAHLAIHDNGLGDVVLLVVAPDGSWAQVTAVPVP